MKIKAIKNWVKVNYPNLNKDLEVELLICFVLGKSKEFVFLNLEYDFDDVAWDLFQSNIEKLSEGKPVEQILGYKEFYGLKLMVNEHVLLPRPESELLVDLAKEFIVDKLNDREMVNVLDVGTGSGAIILALTSVCLKVNGYGVEISDEALKVAQTNAFNLNLLNRVKLQKGDLLNGLQDANFDIILANLPYIGLEKFHFVSEDVDKFEPAIALYGGSDGLDLYRKFFDQLLVMNQLPKLIIGEFGFGQEELMQSILSEKFNSAKLAEKYQVNLEIRPDLAGIPRVFVLGFEKI